MCQLNRESSVEPTHKRRTKGIANIRKTTFTVPQITLRKKSKRQMLIVYFIIAGKLDTVVVRVKAQVDQPGTKKNIKINKQARQSKRQQSKRLIQLEFIK